ncbi:MAG TPA: hypothetical protein ENG36_02505 [Lentisphaerae bacterium]|nr:hypothetical protein [Lentisphaerota bacterium]
MARARRALGQVELIGFMPIILMTVGCLVILLVVNTVIIISNPENIRITSVIRGALYEPGRRTGLETGAPFPFGNREKEPVYFDVHPEYIVLYPGKVRVTLGDLLVPGNPLERMLDLVEQHKDAYYVVILARPQTARLTRKLRKLVQARGIDLGFELFEAEREVEYKPSGRTLILGKKE